MPGFGDLKDDCPCTNEQPASREILPQLRDALESVSEGIHPTLLGDEDDAQAAAGA
jgi:hypothetical protein